MGDAPHSVVLITGGSSGLGLAIAKAFVRNGFHVVIVARTAERLETAAEQVQAEASPRGSVSTKIADMSRGDDVAQLFDGVKAEFDGLDVLVNCVGTSDRGLIENLSADRLRELIDQNVTTALRCTQAALPMLEERSGVIVNIGSLAGKVGARYIGGYSAAKHALAGMTQQMRLELKSRGVHVALVNPGPIRRSDEGMRYESRMDGTLPEQASSPGAGTRVKGLEPEVVAKAVFRAVMRRKPDVILPSHLRLLIAVGHLFPRLGDWLLLKFTSGKRDE